MTGARARAVAALSFVFAAGVVTGIVVNRRYLDAVPTASMPSPVSHEEAMAELRELLALDDAQVEAINAIFAERQKDVQRMWEQLRPEVQEAMLQVHHEISELLRPEQRERFHKWLHQRQNRQVH